MFYTGWSRWLKRMNTTLGGKRERRRRKPAHARLTVEALEIRTVPSAALLPGGTAHLPFTTSETEGTPGATVVSTNADASPTLLDFTDLLGTTADYQVTITWGDGTPASTFLSTDS